MSLPNPIGRQKEVLYLPAQGHCVVLGTAGSGKTTMAILRAAYLSKLAPTQKVMLVTFNKTLVTYLESLGEVELANVDIRTYHHFARGYLKARGRMRDGAILDVDPRLILVNTALSEVRQSQTPISILGRPPEAFAEEIQWISRSGISLEDEYVSAERVGREDSRIMRKDRPAVWKVYQRYIDLRRLAGYDFDWDDIAKSACEEFESDSSPRMYNHIVVDEGQDFSPIMLRSLTLAIPTDGSLTFFGDMAQQIYGSRVSWRSAGLKPPKVWLFKENYRNTKQIAQLGLAISKMPFFRGVADLVEPSSPKADGPLPTVVRCKDKDEEMEFVVKNALIMGRTQCVAILNRNREKDGTYIVRITSHGPSVSVSRLHRDMNTWRSDPGVYVGTYHSAKSLEFDAVLLPYCSEDVLPDSSRIAALGSEDEAKSEEARLLYVAVTRAKVRLIITYSGNVTELLPKESALYQEVEP